MGFTKEQIDNTYICLEKKAETKCICKAFKEQQIEGFCHCGLYEKVYVK